MTRFTGEEPDQQCVRRVQAKQDSPSVMNSAMYLAREGEMALMMRVE